MTAIPGINIASDGRYPVGKILSLVPVGSILRLVIEPKHHQHDYLSMLRSNGFRTLGIIASESLEGMSFEQMSIWVKINLGDVLDYVQLGNEWDHESPSSWTISHGELNRLITAFHVQRELHKLPHKLVLGGAVSGDASKLNGLLLPLIDYVAVHLYGVRPRPGWHPEGHSTWGFGSLPQKLEGYASYGKPLMITEYGLPTQDFGPSIGASFHREMVVALKDLVYAFMPFCMGDDMVPGYGMLDSGGTMKICGSAFRDEVAKLGTQEPIKEKPNVPSFILGFADKAKELGAAVVGTPLEDQDYQVLKNGGEIAFQFTTTGVMLYSKKANKVHFIAGK